MTQLLTEPACAFYLSVQKLYSGRDAFRVTRFVAHLAPFVYPLQIDTFCQQQLGRRGGLRGTGAARLPHRGPSFYCRGEEAANCVVCMLAHRHWCSLCYDCATAA